MRILDQIRRDKFSNGNKYSRFMDIIYDEYNLRDDNCPTTDWVTISDLPKEFADAINANGNAFIRKDSLTNPLSTIFNWEYSKKGGGRKKTHLRICGWANNENNKPSIPSSVKKLFEEQKRRGQARCVICGTTHNLQVDHKIGNHSFGDYDPTNLDNYQWLCGHCNSMKREFCIKCENDNDYEPARDYPPSILCISEKCPQLDKTNCNKCYFRDPIEFNKRLVGK